MTRQSSVDVRLKDFCTPRVGEYIDAVNEHKGVMAASKALGISFQVISEGISKAKKLAADAAREGHAPGHFNSGTAPGYLMGKVTVQRAKDGAVERTWERQSPEDRDRIAYLQSVVDAMGSDLTPAQLVPPPEMTLGHLVTQYTFTDYHLGALCWHKEGGHDWDVKIAQKTGTAAMQMMVTGSPASDTAIVNIQGDWQHFDSHMPVTPTNHHVLSADSRFGRVVDVSIALIRQLVALALQKHSKVILLICEGNHDLASSLWLRKLFKVLYELEPRVAVHDSELPYYAIQWGSTMLAYHHGHLKKNDALPLLFAAMFAPMWGATTKRYINTGHRHHKEDKEHSGCRVIQHPTLTAADAHSARGGWLSERAITAMTFHKEFGEVGTVTVTPEMLA